MLDQNNIYFQIALELCYPVPKQIWPQKSSSSSITISDAVAGSANKQMISLWLCTYVCGKCVCVCLWLYKYKYGFTYPNSSMEKNTYFMQIKLKFKANHLCKVQICSFFFSFSHFHILLWLQHTFIHSLRYPIWFCIAFDIEISLMCSLGSISSCQYSCMFVCSYQPRTRGDRCQRKTIPKLFTLATHKK